MEVTRLLRAVGLAVASILTVAVMGWCAFSVRALGATADDAVSVLLLVLFSGYGMWITTWTLLRWVAMRWSWLDHKSRPPG